MMASVAFRDLISLELVELLGLVFLHSLWLFGLLALLAVFVLRGMHSASSQARYLVALGFLVLMTVCPVATGILLSGRVAGPERSLITAADTGDATPPLTFPSTGSEALAESAGLEESAGHETGVASEPSPTRVVREYTSGNHHDGRVPAGSNRNLVARLIHPWLPSFVVFWLSGALLFSLRPFVGWWTIRQIRRSGIGELSGHVQHLVDATAKKMGVTRAIRFVQSTAVTAPVVVGWLRPLVLLPISVLTGLNGCTVAGRDRSRNCAYPAPRLSDQRSADGRRSCIFLSPCRVVVVRQNSGRA